MKDQREFMLTTKDNPYNPFTHFDEWNAFDISKGYWTCGLLARFANISNRLSDELNDEEIDNAIRSILSIDMIGLYSKVYRDGDNPYPIDKDFWSKVNL